MSYYLTEQQLIEFKLRQGAERFHGAILWDIVKSFKSSSEYSRMQEGERYYNLKHDILFKEKYYYVEGRREKLLGVANNKLIHPFHKILVEQKAAYMVGNPVIIAPPKDLPNAKIQEELSNKLSTIFSYKFDSVLYKWVISAANCGIGWLHVYINQEGVLDYAVIPSVEVIPVYDTAKQEELLTVYRFYEYVDINMDKNQRKSLLKLEEWTKDGVTYWTQEPSGKPYFILDTAKNQNGHFDIIRNNEVYAGLWPVIPFIPLRNNQDGTSDLTNIKVLIDSYDKVKSGWIDDIEDFQELIYVIKDYIGLQSATQQGMSELAIFLQNLKVHKVIPVEGSGDVKTLKAEIPIEARERFLELTRKEIFWFGEGLDLNQDKFGNSPSGVALRFFYAPLDFKANRTIRELKESLVRVIDIALAYMNLQGLSTNLTGRDFTVTVTKSVIFNERDRIETLNESTDLSRRTRLENNPFVEDVDEELKRLQSEEEEALSRVYNVTKSQQQ